MNDLEPSERPGYGETWVYESLVGALPGVSLSPWQAILLQVALFEAALLIVAAAYDLGHAVIPGTAAVAVAALGSLAMLSLGRRTRAAAPPAAYRRLLFGSSVEVVLAVLAFLALVTHLFVFDPRNASPPLVETLFGTEPPVVAVYLMLLILWDLCYRIGTSWWAAVVGLWRARRYELDAPTAAAMGRADLLNVGFGVVQLALLPLLGSQPVLAVAVGGHVVAVAAVSAAARISQRVSRP
jgi:hypothetical protein